VELLQLNLDLVLEKVHAQEAELRELRGRAAAAARETARFTLEHVLTDVAARDAAARMLQADATRKAAELRARQRLEAQEADRRTLRELDTIRRAPADPAREVEAALKALREARDKEARQRAVEALEKALSDLKDKLK
jgi:hypothetical protein